MRRQAKALLILLLVTLALVACGTRQTPEAPPTQTPIYVVITNTPASPTREATPVPEATPTLAGGGTATAGLPAPFTCRAEVVEQTFERGIMFWVGATIEERCRESHSFAVGSGEIWVGIFDASGRAGEWIVALDVWDEAAEPAYDPALVPPAPTLYQPVRGFGRVWREVLTDEQREALGWATGQELKFVTDYRYDAGGFIDATGTYVPRPGTHRLIALNGDEFLFDESSRTVLYPAGQPLPTATPVQIPSPTPLLPPGTPTP